MSDAHGLYEKLGHVRAILGSFVVIKTPYRGPMEGL
jgi:hypothetical protein